MAEYDPYSSSAYAQPINPPTPLAYSYGVPRRPGAVTALAIVSIIVAAFGISCLGVMGLVMAENRAIQARLQQDQLLWAWTVWGGGCRLLLVVLLLAGAIGLFPLARWARSLVIVYGVCMIVLQLVDAYFAVRVANDDRFQVPPSTLIGEVVGYVIWIGHAIWCIALLTSRSVKSAFAALPLPVMPAYSMYGSAVGAPPPWHDPSTLPVVPPDRLGQGNQIPPPPSV